MIILYFILFLAILWIFFNLYPEESKTVSVFGKQIRKVSLLEPLFLPFRPINGLILKGFNLKDKIQNKLDFIRWDIKAVDFLIMKEFFAVVFPLIVFILGIKKIWILVLAFIWGFLLLDFILNSKVNNRKRAIVRFLPETIELLGLCVGAGLDFMSAVTWVIDKVSANPMIEELSIVLKEIKVGKPRAEALRDLGRRVDIPDVRSFTRTLIQADRMGTPVEEAFKILSEDIRMRRFYNAERQARLAPIKMLIPLIFFILPVIFIIVAGPILVNFIVKGFPISM